MFEYNSEGAAHTPDEDFHDWEVYKDDCRRLGRLKQAYLTREYVPRQVSKRWPSPCVDLIIAYAAFMRPLVLKKLKLNQLEPAVRNGREKVFAANLDEHYNHILNLFDTAIEALDHPDTWEVVDDSSDEGGSVKSDSAETMESDGSSVSLVSPPPKNNRKSRKRSSDDDSNDQPPTKRSKSH